MFQIQPRGKEEKRCGPGKKCFPNGLHAGQCQVASGTVPAHQQALRRDPLCKQALVDRHAIVQRSRERVFWRQAVIDHQQ